MTLNITRAGIGSPPFRVQAFALEDDTALVLNAQPDVACKMDEHPIRIMTALYDDVPDSPGCVVVRGHRPFYLHAMVHDFDQEPSFKEAWVSAALSCVFQICEARQVRALALETLGCRHGRLRESKFFELLDAALDDRQFDFLGSVWLVTPGAAT